MNAKSIIIRCGQRDWYVSVIAFRNFNGLIVQAVGFGTTHTMANRNALKDMKEIQALYINLK